jgi:hypothetical protein
MDGLTALRVSTVAAAGVLLVAGCRDHAPPPRRVFVGHVRVGGVGRVHAPRLRACLRRFGELRVTGRTRLVERDGLLGGSLTISDPGSPWLYGCDFPPGA